MRFDCRSNKKGKLLVKESWTISIYFPVRS